MLQSIRVNKNFVVFKDLKMFETLEVQRRMKQLDDDRQQFLAEKAKFETMARLNRPAESGMSRTEIETAIKIAQVFTCNFRNLHFIIYFVEGCCTTIRC